MACSAQDSFITVKQQHETGEYLITLNQPHQTTITVKQEHETGDSIITVKHQHQTGDSIITVKHEHQTGDSFVTVKKKKQQQPTGEDSFITVKVKELLGRVEDFRVKRDEPLQQLMMRWRDEQGIADYEIVRLIFNGRTLDNKTANDIGLKDGDCIYVARYKRRAISWW